MRLEGIKIKATNSARGKVHPVGRRGEIERSWNGVEILKLLLLLVETTSKRWAQLPQFHILRVV